MSDWEDEETVVEMKPKAMPQQNNPNEWNANQSNDGWAADQNENFMAVDNGGSDTISFEIEQNEVGMVIGRGGARCREIEEKFSIKLKIGK